MSKYPNISEICDSVSFADVFSALGVKPPKRGRFHCPSRDHEDKEASASIGRKDGRELFNCFACGAAGNVVGLAMMLKNWPMNHTKDWLRETFMSDWKSSETFTVRERKKIGDQYMTSARLLLKMVPRRSTIDERFSHELARVMEENPYPREGFEDIYEAHYPNLLLRLNKWAREETDWSSRIYGLRKWESELLEAYQTRMRENAAPAAREEHERRVNAGEDVSYPSEGNLSSDAERFEDSYRQLRGTQSFGEIEGESGKFSFTRFSDVEVGPDGWVIDP